MSEPAARARPDQGEGPPSPWDWSGGYATRPGRPDELTDGSGRTRPVWSRFLHRLSGLSPAEMERRFETSDRHIRETGVSYRIYGEQGERSWPLGSLPFIVEAAEWRDLAAGIVQRAGLMEAILRDVYGEGRLVADGLLPAALVAGCPEFMRPLHGMPPRGGRHLNLYAADLARGPDGRWTVLADRTQAPSGMGYALENRLVLARAYPELYAAMDVERLAPFFQAFRAGLAGAAERSDPRICLLTSGPHSETYFEQAYLARYLNLLLVEGDDLIVRDGRLHVRTVDGLKRADVVWRRVDSDFVDPMELNPASRLGVPGLLDALRVGNLVVGNMPGSGVVEAAGFAPFLPEIARRLLGEDLRLAGVASWWCGDPTTAGDWAGRLQELSLVSAYGPPPAAASPRAPLTAALRDRPFDVVAREPVSFSTAPTFGHGRLEPRPFTLRVFAAAGPDGWVVMPGGFSRYAEDPDGAPVAMGAGIRSADVWVVSDRPVRSVSLLPTDDGVRIRRVAGHLPSRAADNLFWFGRYLERAETVVRLVRALLNVLGDASGEDAATLARIGGLLRMWGSVAPDGEDPAGQALTALAGRAPVRSALAHVASARAVASNLRERLPGVTWRALNELTTTLDLGPDATPSVAELLAVADGALVSLAALAGLTHENMNRAAGWHFAHMGRRIERSINTAGFTRVFAAGDADACGLSVLLELVDAQITFGSRYILGTAVGPARDIAFLDPFNPRSVAYQLTSLDRHLADLPHLTSDGMPEPQARAARKLASDVAALDVSDLESELLETLEGRIASLSDLIGTRFFPGGPDAVRPEKLTGLA